MNTDWQQRRQIEERLATWEGLSIDEARDLIADADSGEIAEALLEGLKEVLVTQFGIEVVDTTTDDDNGEHSFMLVPVESNRSDSVLE